jgi:hypothetical protein
MASHPYCRETDLPKLIGLRPHEFADPSRVDHQKLIAKLERALRAERRRGRSGCWTYNLARHDQLLVAYRAERRAWLRTKRSINRNGCSTGSGSRS